MEHFHQQHRSKINLMFEQQHYKLLQDGFLTDLSIQVNIILKIKKALTIINTVKAYYLMLVKRVITYAF